MMINKLNRFRKMIPIGDHDFGVILSYSYPDRFVISKRVYLVSIDYYPYLQKIQQYLVFPGNDNMIRW